MSAFDAAGLARPNRTTVLLRNLAGILTGKVGTFIASLLLVRFIIQAAGLETYGLWAVCMHVLAYAMVLDFGLGLGLQNAMSHASGQLQRQAILRIATVVAGALVVVAVICLVVYWALASIKPSFLVWMFGPDLPAPQQSTGLQFLGLTICVLCLSLVLQIPVRLAAGLQRIGGPGIAQGIASLLAVATFPFAVGQGVPLLTALAFTLTIPLVVQAAMAWWELHRCGFRWPVIRTNPAVTAAIAVGAQVGPTLSAVVIAGLAIFLSQVSSVIVFQTDIIILSAYSGPLPTASYEVHARLLSIPLVIQGIALASLWPAFAQGWSQGDMAWVTSTYRRAVLICCLGMIPMVVVLALALPWLIPLWTGVDTLSADPALTWFYVLFVASSLWAGLNATCLNAIGKVRFTAVIAASQAVLNLLVVLLVVKWGGWAIAAASGVVALVVNAIPLFWWWRRSVKERITVPV